MPIELRNPEQLQAEIFHYIHSSSKKITEAIRAAGLESSNKLCHEVNLSLAIALNRQFGLPVSRLDMVLSSNQPDTSPRIAYIVNGKINVPHPLNRREKHPIPHSYFLLLGFPKTIVVDGANDQARPSQPLLLRGLQTSVHPEFLKRELFRYDHSFASVEESDFLLDIARNFPTEFGRIVVRNILSQIQAGTVTREQAAIALAECQEESDWGIGFATIMCKRDWMEYFTRLMGVSYPSIQELINPVRQELGLPISYESYLEREKMEKEEANLRKIGRQLVRTQRASQ